MKFKTISQYYQQSECGHWLISLSRVAGQCVFTLTKDSVMIAQERCNDFASERALAVKELQKMAGEHGKQ